MNYLTVGDEIEVNGDRFILVSYTAERNKPARVVFKQPMEFLEESKSE